MLSAWPPCWLMEPMHCWHPRMEVSQWGGWQESQNPAVMLQHILPHAAVGQPSQPGPWPLFACCSMHIACLKLQAVQAKSIDFV
jgi:hypothetical protein